MHGAHTNAAKHAYTLFDIETDGGALSHMETAQQIGKSTRSVALEMRMEREREIGQAIHMA